MDKKELTKDVKIKIIVITALMFLISVVGVSYAFFSIQVTGNEQASSINVTTANLSLLYTDGPGINITGVYPGWSTTKTFSVKNTGNKTVYYDIKMYNVYSTFVRDDLVYTLTSTNSGGTKTETVMPNNDGLIKARISIAPNVTQTYTMTITFKELNDKQDYNQAASFSGIIQIISPYTYTDEGSIQDYLLVDRIMLDNTTAYPTNTSSKYVTTSGGITYSKPSDYRYNGYYTYEEDVNFTSNANKALGTTFSYNADSGYFKVTGTTASSQTYSSADVGKYTCYSSNTTACYYNPQELYKILAVDGSTVTKVERYVAKPNTTSWNGLGLYQTSSNTVDNATTYFFRGHVINNYLSFAGDLWRIVRIAEDGTIRIIRQNNYVAKAFNTTRTDPMYVGYMFGTSSDPYTNTNDSNIKTQVEAYYDSKLASLSSYLAPIEFCNDRTIGSTSGSNIYYGAYTRLYTNKAPIFTCPNETRDLFTLTTSSKGNKKLTKSVGLLTMDEAAYAGATYDRLSQNYLNNNNFWWTSSPYNFTSSITRVWNEYAGGTSSGNYATSSYGVRPVVSLKADTVVYGGSGSSNDPYIITQ